MKDKFWTIIKVNGVTELHKDDEDKLITYTSERDAIIAAEEIVSAWQGTVCAIVVEGKSFYKYMPFVEKTLLTVVEADVARSAKISVETQA